MSSKTFTLGQKLAGAFLAMVAINAAVGGFAVSRLGQVNESTEDIATSWLPSVRALGEIRSLANQIRRAESDHLVSDNPQEMAPVEARLSSLEADFKARLKAYEPLISSPQERTLVEAIGQDYARYLEAQQRLLPLSREGQAKMAEAKAAYRGDSRSTFAAMMADLDKAVALNVQGSDTAAAAAKDTYHAARLALLGMLAAAFAAALALAALIVRNVKGQLGGEPDEAADLARRVAAGDLSVPIELKQGDGSSLLAALKRMQDNLAMLVLKVRENAEGVATASSQIAQGNNDLSGRTEEQASALQQTAASMEQLGSTVRQNAENASQASQLAASASIVATQGGSAVSEVVATMKEIDEASSRIASIIGVIDGIAFQTNILALNAAVEAARAGEQGRGFAVVAGEVRSLAGRCAEAAREVKSLIAASGERVQRGCEQVGSAGSKMEEIVGSIRRVTDIMGEISAASQEQSAGVGQIGGAVAQMDQVTQQNAALVEESAAAAESLKAQAMRLVEVVSVFKLQPQPA